MVEFNMITVVVKFVDKTIFTQDFSENKSIIVKVEDAKNKFYLKILVGGHLVLLSPLENIEYYFAKHYDYFSKME